MNFESLLREYKEKVDNELELFFDKKIKELKDSFLRLNYSYAKEFVLHGGKRLRPISMIMAYNAVNKGNEKSILAPSLSVELVHNSTLVHDDIMDEDELRRNHPTMHKQSRDWFLECQKSQISEHAQEPPVRDGRFLTNYKGAKNEGSLFNNASSRFAVSNAILCGNILLSLGYSALDMADNKNSKKACFVYNQAYNEVVDGQIMDILTSFNDISEKKYFDIIAKKTAALFKASVEIGAILGGADKGQTESLSEYALQAALAFQIKDDVMDVSHEMDKGHELGSDIKQGKKNLLIIKALEFSDNRNKKIINNILGKENATSEEVDSVIELFKSTGAIDYAEKLSKEKIKSAKEHLKKAELNKESSEFFSKLADYMVDRKV